MQSQDDNGEKAATNSAVNTNIHFNHHEAAQISENIDLFNLNASQKFSQESSPVKAAGSMKIGQQRASEDDEGGVAAIEGAGTEAKAGLTSDG